MKKLYLLTLILFALVLVGCSKNDGKLTDESNGNSNTNIIMTGNLYTSQDVATHKSKQSCRTTINNKVYDITTFFGKHKGGDEILASLCGLDGSAGFNGKHGTNDIAKSVLSTLYIGDLK